MNKKLYFLATVAIFAACSSNDVKNDIAENSNEIGFTAVTYKATKAEITGNAALASEGGFVVWGYKAKNQTTMDWAEEAYTVFNAVNVHVKSGQDGAYINTNETDWTYDTKKYWDKNASYCFYAVAPYNPSSGTYSISEGANNTKMISITGATSGLASASDDFLISRGGVKDRKGTNQDNVDFTFHHTMAKIDFLLKKGDNITDEVKVQKITMTGWNNGSGNFVQSSDATPANLSHSEWTIPTSGTGSIDILTSESAALSTTGVATTTLPCIMVPQTIAANDLTFTIDFKVAGEPFKAQVGSVAAQQIWGTDSHITYTITIDPKTIEFDVASICGFDRTGTGSATVPVE